MKVFYFIVPPPLPTPHHPSLPHPLPPPFPPYFMNLFILFLLGYLIHIDYGFILTISPGGMNFESAPFKLTQVNSIYVNIY